MKLKPPAILEYPSRSQTAYDFLPMSSIYKPLNNKLGGEECKWICEKGSALPLTFHDALL